VDRVDGDPAGMDAADRARLSSAPSFTVDASRKMRLGNPPLPDDVSIIVLELGL
jgi:hypothetical protein